MNFCAKIKQKYARFPRRLFWSTVFSLAAKIIADGQKDARFWVSILEQGVVWYRELCCLSKRLLLQLLPQARFFCCQVFQDDAEASLVTQGRFKMTLLKVTLILLLLHFHATKAIDFKVASLNLVSISGKTLLSNFSFFFSPVFTGFYWLFSGYFFL